MHPCSRIAAALVAATAGSLVLAGCGGGQDEVPVDRSPAPYATVGPDFLDEASPPPPEGTITPSPGSWVHVHAPQGYRAVLVSMGADPQTTTLVAAIDGWAAEEGVQLRHVVVADHGQIIDRVTEAIALDADVVITAGNGLIDALALITAAHLQQKFLVVGAELAEPTHNVTAADWPGASFRGEGLGASSTYDPSSFTPERTARAIRAGMAAVLSNHTGIVIWLD